MYVRKNGWLRMRQLPPKVIIQIANCYRWHLLSLSATSRFPTTPPPSPTPSPSRSPSLPTVPSPPPSSGKSSMWAPPAMNSTTSFSRSSRADLFSSPPPWGSPWTAPPLTSPESPEKNWHVILFLFRHHCSNNNCELQKAGVRPHRLLRA